MSLDLGRRLLASGAIHAGELRRALHEALVRERPLARALVEASASARSLLERPLEEGHHPVVRSVIPHDELLAALPPGLAARLLAVPMRKDARTSTVDLAVVDPLDTHAIAEVAFHLGAPVRAIAAPLVEIERALLLSPAGEPLLLEPKVTTAEYEKAKEPPPVEAPAPGPTIAPTSRPDEFAVPLVRRARGSLMPTESPTTTPYERAPKPRVEMVVDFSAAARAEKEEAAVSTQRGVPPDPSGRLLPLKRPPFPSLTPILERIDVVADRDSLIEATLRGLATTATCAALFAPRRGRFVGVGAAGELDSEIVRGAIVPAHGAMAETVGKGERLGALDPESDRDLFAALDLQRLQRAQVLLQASYLSERAALVLVAYGMSDVAEASRRSRVLATAASAAMSRILKR